jgi:hypothetical protein
VGPASNLFFAVLIGFGHPFLLAASIKHSRLRSVPTRFDDENAMSPVLNPLDAGSCRQSLFAAGAG